MLLRHILCVILVCICYFTIALLALDVPDSREWAQFVDFMTRYNKSYRHNSTVVLQRFKVFQESLRRHEQLNAYEAQNGGTAVYGVNVFSDLTPEEFKRTYLSGLSPSPPSKACYSSVNHSTASPPDKFDWRDNNVIGPIRNQQQCGSCWAFAVVETIASRYAIQSKHLYELSPQQLISCDYDPSAGLEGCSGGEICSALSTLVDQKMVIVQESVYPFNSGKDGTTTPCKRSLPHIGLQLNTYDSYYSYNETSMKELLFTTSPLTVAINAVPWQDYIGGIIQHHCSTGSLDHAVQIVGYDTTGPIPYWTVRNTWGTGWGEDGYVRIKYGSNMCGITREVSAVSSVTAIGLQV